jgi:tetratricopeptide (TPR) repeat protein
MIIRAFIVSIVVLSAPATVLAQEAKDSTSATIEVAPPIDPAKKQAEDIDRLFGTLQQEDVRNPGSTIEKIWALWSRNDSAMAEVLLTQSTKAMKDGAFGTSEKMLNELLGSYTDYVEALNKRAMLYYNMKRYDEALEDINAVLDIEPRHFGALSGRAAVYQAQGKVAEAVASLREAIAVNPYLETAKAILKQLEHDYPDI